MTILSKYKVKKVLSITSFLKILGIKAFLILGYLDIIWDSLDGLPLSALAINK